MQTTRRLLHQNVAELCGKLVLGGDVVKYLYGDSTESGLEVDFLAFLKDALDCLVVLVETEAALASTSDRRRVHEQSTAAVVAEVEGLGRRTTDLVQPVAKDHGEAPVGRAAAAIVAATRQAIEREISQARSVLAAEIGQLDKKDQQLRENCRIALEKLLRVHDLPGAQQVFEVTWASTGVTATLRQQTKIGVEALLELELPAASVLAADLRVDRLAEGIEVSALEAGGWLKKSDKLVPHKVGRYHVVRVTVAGEVTTVRVCSTADPSSAGFEFKLKDGGSVALERTGHDGAGELSIDDRSRAQLDVLVAKLETAVRALGDHRAALTSLKIDGTSLAELPHPRALADRLIAAIAPVVHDIARHSHSPGELVLRVPVGNGRREELFATTESLVKRYSRLPAAERAAFAPLRLEADVPAPPPVTPAEPPAAAAGEIVSGPAPAPAPARPSGPTRPPPPPAARTKPPSQAPAEVPASEGEHVPKERAKSIAAEPEELSASIDVAFGEAGDDAPTRVDRK